MNNEDDFNYSSDDSVDYSSDDGYFNEEADIQSDIEPDRTAEDDTPVYSDRPSNSRSIGYYFVIMLGILVLLGTSFMGFKALRDKRSGTSQIDLQEANPFGSEEFKGLEEEPVEDEPEEPAVEEPAEPEQPTEEKKEETKKKKKKTNTNNNNSSSNNGSTTQPNTNNPTEPEPEVPTYTAKSVHYAYISIAGGFNANDEVTRGEFARWVCMAQRININDVQFKQVFNDVTKETHDWQYIIKLYDLELVSGRPSSDGTLPSYKPDEPIKRIEAAIVVLNLIDKFNLTNPKEECKAVYHDIVTPDNWIYKPLQRAMKTCILKYYPGVQGRVLPEYPLTKATGAYMIYRALSRDVVHESWTCDEYSIEQINGLKVDKIYEEAILDGVQTHTCYKYD